MASIRSRGADKGLSHESVFVSRKEVDTFTYTLPPSYDNIWSYIIIYDHTLSYTIIYDHVWPHMFVYDHIWSYMIISDQIWSYVIIYDQIWSYMIIYDHIWSFIMYVIIWSYIPANPLVTSSPPPSLPPQVRMFTLNIYKGDVFLFHSCMASVRAQGGP